MMMHVKCNDAQALADRRAHLARAIKCEARWQVLAGRIDAAGDVETYRKMRGLYVTGMNNARARRISADVLGGEDFYNAVEAYAKLFAALHAHRRAQHHKRRWCTNG